MNGNDVKKLFEDLDLNPINASRLIGVELKQFHSLVGYRDLTFGPEAPVPSISMELLVELWRQVESMFNTKDSDSSHDGAKAYGSMLERAMHKHGAMYAAWLIMDDRCSEIFENELLSTKGLSNQDTEH